MRDFASYECDGQMNIFDFLESPHKSDLPCDDCIYCDNGCCDYDTKNMYCVEGDRQLRKSEGWHRIKKQGNGYVGDFPECTTWQRIETWAYCDDLDLYVHGTHSEAKDKTIKRYQGGDIGEIVAWRYL